MTGTFDNWTKSVKLDKEGDIFQKTVPLNDASEKIYYKVGEPVGLGVVLRHSAGMLRRFASASVSVFALPYIAFPSIL